MRRDYIWPRMRTDCKRFVSRCVLCARNKPSCHRPYGLLQPLPIPEIPWHSIILDSIEQLPPSNSFTAILVVIDRLSKEGVFIPTTGNATSTDALEAFVTQVFAKQGIRSMCSPIAARNSPRISSVFSAHYLECTFISHRDTTPQPTDKSGASIAPSSKIYEFTATGQSSYRQQKLRTITPPTLLRVSPSPPGVVTHSLPFTRTPKSLIYTHDIPQSTSTKTTSSCAIA